MNESVLMAQLPRYQCHKKVWALKIEHIQDVTKDGGPFKALITPVDKRYAPFEVDAAYMFKHQPKVGGYWVQYEGGYQSFSPAKEFEEGYTLI